MLRLNLTKKMVLMLLVFGILPLAAVSAIALVATNGMIDGSGRRLQSLSKDLTDKIDRNLFERYGDVQAFAVNAAVLRRDDWYKQGETPLVRAMNDYVRLYGVYFLSILVDPAGRVIAVNSKDPNGKPIASWDPLESTCRHASLSIL